jgi:transketolase C-terminal domain/subunit
MIGAAIGLAALGFVPILSTFSSFFSRAFDQLRMNNISKTKIKM